MRNKFLEDIGLEDYGVMFCDDSDDERQQEWKQERKEWGFDSREVWNLDITFAEWLYSRLKMFEMTEGKKLDQCGFVIDGKTKSFDECLKLALCLTREFLEAPFDERRAEDISDAAYIFGQMLPVLYVEKCQPNQKTLKEQESLYGFNETEVYNMGRTFVRWLYPHVDMFDITNVLYTHDIMIPVDEENDADMQECIDTVLDYCEEYMDEPNIGALMDISSVWENLVPYMNG